jgi:hypothetical protein
MAGGAETPNIAALPAIARGQAAIRRPRKTPRRRSDICQQLLFKGNVDQIVIRDHSLIASVNMTAERGNGLIAAGSSLRPPRRHRECPLVGCKPEVIGAR